MSFAVTELLVAAAILGFSAMVQATIGFAFALFAIPLLVFAGFDVVTAITTSTTAMTIQMLIGVIRLKAEVELRPMLAPILLSFPALALGIALLRVLNDVRPEALEQVVGIALLLIVVAIVTIRPTPRESQHPGWAITAASTSGFLSGLTGMGGPPVAIWAIAHDWPTGRTKAAIWWLVLPRMPVQLLFFCITFGPAAVHALLVGLIATPMVVVGSTLGLRLGAPIPVPTLRAIALIVLGVIATRAILAPMIG